MIPLGMHVHESELAIEFARVHSAKRQLAVGIIERSSRGEGDSHFFRVQQTQGERIIGDCRDEFVA